MRTFYNIFIGLGWVGSLAMGWLIDTSPLPWWRWIISGIACLLIQFGCYAQRDKKHDQERANP